MNKLFLPEVLRTVQSRWRPRSVPGVLLHVRELEPEKKYQKFRVVLAVALYCTVCYILLVTKEKVWKLMLNFNTVENVLYIPDLR